MVEVLVLLLVTAIKMNKKMGCCVIQNAKLVIMESVLCAGKIVRWVNAMTESFVTKVIFNLMVEVLVQLLKIVMTDMSIKVGFAIIIADLVIAEN